MTGPTVTTPAAGTTMTPEAAMAAISAMRAEIRELDKVTDKSGKERHILDRNFKLRRKNAELEFELNQLKAAKPADGSVVLSKDDAAIWADFKKLNVKPADLTTLIKEHGELKAKVDARTQEEQFAEAAEALGFENIPLFTRMLTREGLHLEFQDVREKDEETGKMVTVRMPMVRPAKDDKAKLEPLPDYLEREVPELIPVLQAESTASAGGDEGDEGDDDHAGVGSTGSTAISRAVRALRSTNTRQRTEERRPVTGGVAMPLARGTRPSTGAARTEKKDRDAIEEKRANPIYAGL